MINFCRCDECICGSTDAVTTTQTSVDEPKAIITTYGKNKIDPLNPEPDKFTIYDIAHSLSLICRWNGQVKEFFSVAQHCIYVSYLCDPKDALIGLLHDAAEAYLGDMSAPVKHLPCMKEYIILEKKFEAAIATALNLPSIEKTPSVELADSLVLAKEAMELGRSMPSKCLPLMDKWKGILDCMKWEVLKPEDACLAFMERYNSLRFQRKINGKTKETN